MPDKRNGVGKGSETFHNTVKQGSTMYEAKSPVRMRLEGWARATPCVAESTRQKSAKYGGGMGVGDREAERPAGR